MHVRNLSRSDVDRGTSIEDYKIKNIKATMEKMTAFIEENCCIRFGIFACDDFVVEQDDATKLCHIMVQSRWRNQVDLTCSK